MNRRSFLWFIVTAPIAAPRAIVAQTPPTVTLTASQALLRLRHGIKYSRLSAEVEFDYSKLKRLGVGGMFDVPAIVRRGEHATREGGVTNASLKSQLSRCHQRRKKLQEII